METRTLLIITATLFNLGLFNAHAEVNGLVFRLEVELIQRPNLSDFDNFQPSEGIMSKGEKVLAGTYNHYLLAMKAKYGFAKVSSNPVVIVAFYNNDRVSLDEAFAICNNENKTDQLVIHRPDSASTSETMARLKSIPYYTFEFYTDADHTLDMLFKKHPEWNGKATALSNGVYLVGNYAQYSAAIAAQQTLDSEGFKRNTLVAYQNDKQIPVLVAMGFEDKSKPQDVAQQK